VFSTWTLISLSQKYEILISDKDFLMPSKTNIVLLVLHKFSVILMLRTSKISQCGIWFPNLVAWSYLVVKWSLLRFTFIQEALIFAQKAAAPAAIWSPRSHLVAHQVAGASGRQSGVVVDAFSFSNLSAGLNALHANIWHVLSFTYVPSYWFGPNRECTPIWSVIRI